MRFATFRRCAIRRAIDRIWEIETGFLRAQREDLVVLFKRIQRPSTTSMPDRIDSSLARDNLPARSVSNERSSATSCEVFATDSLGNPVCLADRLVLPGAAAQRRLLVSGTQTTFAMRLRLSASPCTTTTGLRNPGPDPTGSGRSAHQTSPCEITIRCA